MDRDMKKWLLFATVFALAIVATSNWTSGNVGIPDLEIKVQFNFSLKGDDDLRNES